MPELQPLQPAHADAVRRFEETNREYFARFISDRGDAYFEEFAAGFSWLVADQEAGNAAYYLLMSDDGEVLGRFNLIMTGDGIAELGYRVAESAAGHGVATATVVEMCAVAASRHGVHLIRAAISDHNVASRRVLVKAGFEQVGKADPERLGGKSGSWFERLLDTPS